MRHPRFVLAKWHRFWEIREYCVQVSRLCIDEVILLGFTDGFFFGLWEGGSDIFVGERQVTSETSQDIVAWWFRLCINYVAYATHGCGRQCGWLRTV
jgi:hypothetical protein